MIQALLAGRKTVTRRLSESWLKVKQGHGLWVRENLIRPDGDPWLYAADRQPVMVDAADETAMLVWAHHKDQDYCPSIHMPRWASRITLEATEDARPERLQDITEEEALAEGVEPFEMSAEELADLQISDESPDVKNFWAAMGPGRASARWNFEMLWADLHNEPGERWKDNPKLVRLAFRPDATRTDSVCNPVEPPDVGGALK